MKNNGESKNKSINLLVWIVLIVAVYAAAVATIIFISTPKIGYIDTNIMLQKYPAAVEARETMQKESEEWSNNIKTLETELNELNQAFIQKGTGWSKSVLARKKEELEKKQQEYMRYTRAINEKATKREKELMQPIFDELNVYVSDFGKEKGYDMIWGTVAGGNILYGHDASDLTDEFLKYVEGRM